MIGRNKKSSIRTRHLAWLRLVAGWWLVTVLPTGSDATNNILLVGDSWAELAGTELLQEACGGDATTTTVQNIGEGGSTAERWASSLDGRLLSVPTNFTPSHVWISLGLNDFAFNDCTPEGGPAGVASNIRIVMEGLAERYPMASFLLTDYGIPSQSISVWLDRFPCVNPATYRDIESVYTDYDYYGNATTVVLISELFGGSIGDDEDGLAFSDNMFYADPIHLNENGYRRLFSHPPILEALGCCCQTAVAAATTTNTSSTNTSAASFHNKSTLC